MTPRPRWILDIDADFPASAAVAARVPDPVVVPRVTPGLEVWPDVEGPVVGYGTMRTMTRMRRSKLARAVFDDYASLRCSSYYGAIYDLLGRAAFLIPMAALGHLDLRRHLGERVFIRSDSNYKLFAAEALPATEAARFLEQRWEHRDELVVVAEVVALGDEYRVFCRRGKAFCHSSYPVEPYRPAPPEVVAFAEAAAERLAGVVPSGMLTVDVAVGADRLRIVEVGGVNSWGIYGSDIDAFIATMEAEALACDADFRDE
jgi:ATP-grasp domain-containing protein